MYMYCASDTVILYHLTRWYYGSMTRHTAESILSMHGEGSFLVRNSEIHDGYTFSVVRSAVLV